MEKLIKIQSELKVPKLHHNSFGNYNYRNAEDILDAVKPLLIRENLLLNITDELVMLGSRFYVKSTVSLIDENNKCIQSTGYAREEETKKGMDSSQITGSCSSYARKYALNGLFLIDDVKDSDSSKPEEKMTHTPKQAPTTTDNKPWLNPGTEAYTAAIKWLQTEPSATIAGIEKKYKISKKTMEQLLTDVETTL
jgi:hypothetical protein